MFTEEYRFQDTKECLQQYIRDIGPSMGEENDVGLIITGKVSEKLFYGFIKRRGFRILSKRDNCRSGSAVSF